MRNRNTSFTSRPVNMVNIKKVMPEGGNSLVGAVYAKLDTKSEVDKHIVEQIKNTWPRVHELITQFCSDFTKYVSSDVEYSVLQLKDLPVEHEHEKIVGLMKTQVKSDGGKNKLYLSQICSRPEFMKAENEARQLKGVGEIMLGEALFKARKIGATHLEFYSLCNDFYIKALVNAGINIRDKNKVLIEGHEFTIYPKAYDQYIKYCEKEYGSNFAAKIPPDYVHPSSSTKSNGVIDRVKSMFSQK